MKYARLMCFMLAGLVQSTRADIVASFASYHNGKQFSFDLERVRLESNLIWKDNEDAPPLSPRKALVAAQAQFNRLVGNARRWSLHELVLLQAGPGKHWIYLVRFAPPIPKGGLKGKLQTFDIVVLMRGETIDPVISDLGKQ